MSDLNTEYVSDQTKNKIEDFSQKSSAFKELFNQLMAEHPAAIEQFNNSVEAMNAALDDAKRSLREDADQADYRKVKKIKIGEFTATKKWSSWLIVEGTVEILKDLGLLDAAIDEGVVIIETKVDSKLAQEFFRKNSVEANFKVVEDGKELTPAVTCPKPVAPFGGILK